MQISHSLFENAKGIIVSSAYRINRVVIKTVIF